MRSPARLGVLLVMLCAAALLLACPAAKEAAGCESAADCEAGARCSAGSCVEGGGGGDGGGGGTGAADACAASDDCRTEPFDLIPNVYWDGDDGQPVCTVRPGSCPQGGACTLPTECRDALDGRPGLFRCAVDEDCASGRCLQHLGVGLCLRACGEDEDCPQVIRHPGVTGGFRCGSTEQRGVVIHGCLPLDDSHPERTLCANDEDCGLPGAGAPAGVACRFLGKRSYPIDAVPICDALPEQPSATGTACPWDPVALESDATFSATCAGGTCNRICGRGERDAANVCFLPSAFCTQPCRLDADCPTRWLCGVGGAQERVGAWMHPSAGQVVGEPGRDVDYCRLPDGGCFDELDCCPVPDGQGGCLGGWSAVRQRCSVVPLQQGTRSRLLTLCAPPGEGLAPPGSCCTEHEQCDSYLCVPARPGSDCASSGVCSIPCAPVPDPDGIPGSGDERDRCASADLPGATYHLGSTCKPFDYTRRFVDPGGLERTLEATLAACQ